MSWIGNIFKRFSLTEKDRKAIAQFFGSFRANQFALSSGNYLSEGYEKNVDVYSLIKKIKDTSSTIPWIIEKKTSAGWEEVDGTPLHALLQAPNKTKGYTWEDLNEMMDVYILSTGNAYMLGQEAIGFRGFAELDVLPSNHIKIKSNNDFLNPNISYEFELGGTKESFENEQIAHLKLFNPAYSSVNESLYGLSPIQVAARVVQVGNDRWEADANLTQNRGAIGLITDKSQMPMKAEEADKIQRGFDRRVGGPGNFGRVVVTNKDLNYIQLAMSPQDLQLVEHGVVNLRAMCNVFGLDSSLFNDPANKTFNNRKEAEKALYTNAVIPLNRKKYQHFNRFLIPQFFPGEQYRIRPNYSEIEVLQEDKHEKAKTYALLKTSGIITANQAAEALGQELSTDPNADKLIVSNSLTLLESIGQPPNTTANEQETNI